MSFFNNKYLLGDIGGTNTRLAIVKGKNNTFDFIKKAYYKNSDLTDITETIKEFVYNNKIKLACFAVAGPLNSDRTKVKLTNNNWLIDSNYISKITSCKVILLNDFEALGFSINTLKKEQYIELTTKGIDLSGTISIIGAGTGLGMSILYPYGGKYYPIPTEGGHSSIFFNPKSKFEMDLYAFMSKRKIIIEAESLVSGRGIELIYNFLLTKGFKHNKKVIKEIQNSTNKPELITKYALQDKDPLCIKTIELFIIFYSRVARDLALKTLCTSLVIAGGIAPKILPFMKDMFLEAFIEHEHIEARKMLEEMSIIVLTDQDIAFYGCYNAIKS
ncbi:MAG: glucokinase [Candidatus Woesearchaeota archaeon]